MRRVVVTGVGVLHPCGEDRASFRAAIAAGERWPTLRLGRKLDYKKVFPESSKRIKKMDMVGKYASYSALLALRDAGLEAPPEPHRAGLVTGTMFGGLEACASFHEQLVTLGPDNVNPVHFPNTAHNVPCGHVAITLGLKGPVLALASGLAASHDALVAGTRMIRTGRADMVLAGGFDRMIPELDHALNQAGLGSTDLHPAEGACFVVLEEESAARSRGAAIRGRVLAYGQASDLAPPGGWSARGKALVKALGLALERSDGAPDLATACLATQGVPAYDAAVHSAYETVLGEAFRDLRKVRPKRVLGETFGASGAFALACLLEEWGEERLPRAPALLDGLAWGGAATALVLAP